MRTKWIMAALLASGSIGCSGGSSSSTSSTTSGAGATTGTTGTTGGSGATTGGSSGATGSHGATASSGSSGSVGASTGSTGSTGDAPDGGSYIDMTVNGQQVHMAESPSLTHASQAAWYFSAAQGLPSDGGLAHSMTIDLSNPAPDGGFGDPEPGTYLCSAVLGQQLAGLLYTYASGTGQNGYFGVYNDAGPCYVEVTNWPAVGGHFTGSFAGLLNNSFHPADGGTADVSGSFDIVRTQ